MLHSVAPRLASPVRLATFATVFACLAASHSASNDSAKAEEFCMETDVFVGNADEPVVRTRTLFVSGVVYDFLLNESEETAVFDPKRGKFVLLDSQRKIQTSLTTEDILQFTAAVQAAGKRDGEELFSQRNWSLQEGETEGELILSGKRIRYWTKGAKPDHATICRQYREFADWYARLNAMRKGNVPPFARIELNKALSQRGLLPVEIERSVTADRVGLRKFVVRSRHLLHERISNTDRKRIREAAELQATLPLVSFLEYRKPSVADD